MDRYTCIATLQQTSHHIQTGSLKIGSIVPIPAFKPRQQGYSGSNFNVICWNVRGLNMPVRRTTVHETLTSTTCHLACLQETKLENIDQALAYSLGGYKLHKFAQRPAFGMRGGILLLWNDNFISVESARLEANSLLATITIKECSTVHCLMVVYGPSLTRINWLSWKNLGLLNIQRIADG